MKLKETDSEILGRLLCLEGKRLSTEKAHLVLSLKFSSEDRRRIDELGEKSNEGTLSVREKELYDAYVRVTDFLGILQSRARRSLRKLEKAG
jgi:hypothetical protein